MTEKIIIIGEAKSSDINISSSIRENNTILLKDVFINNIKIEKPERFEYDQIKFTIHITRTS